MRPILAGEPEGLLESLKRACGAVWGDLFTEIRCVARREFVDGREPAETVAWDAGSGIRCVTKEGRVLHAAADGPVERAASEAAHTLLAGLGLEKPGAPGQPAPSPLLSCEPPSEGQAGLSLAGFDDWRLAQSRGISAYCGDLASEIESAIGGACRIRIEATISRQQIEHRSTDSPLVGDVRTGVLVVVRLSGGGATILRRWAAADVASLLSGRPPEGEGARMAEGLRLQSDAAPSPEGEFPVVFTPGSGGLLLHEAVGHMLEGDIVARCGTALLAGHGVGSAHARSASPLLSRLLTVVEDPGGIQGRGGYRFDDEGKPALRTSLVESGHVVRPIGSRWSGVPSTGHARRQSHRDCPLPRSGAIFCERGPHDPLEIIEGTERGLYVEELRSGHSDPASGEFVLHAGEGRLIEGGRLTGAVRDLLISGNTRESLSLVDRVGDDLAFDGGAGSCVRSGQAISTIVGLPTLRIARIRVAGMADT